MPDKIDYNRGVIKGKDQTSGVAVYMYIDTPGVYLSEQGTQVTAELAKKAGFDVDKYRVARLKSERLAKAKHIIEQELEADNSKKKAIKEKNGWAIVHLGFGRHVIEDPDGNEMTERQLTREEAEVVFEQLIPDEVEATDDSANQAAAEAATRFAKGAKVGTRKAPVVKSLDPETE